MLLLLGLALGQGHGRTQWVWRGGSAGLPGDWDSSWTSPEHLLPFRALLGDRRLHSAQPLCWGRGPLFSLVTIPVWMEMAVSHPCIWEPAQLFMYRKKPFVKNALFIKQNIFLPKGGAQHLSLSYAFSTNYCLRLKMIGREN